MAFPTFHKASDLLNADNMVKASAQLSRALSTAGLGFNLGMNNLGEIIGDTQEADLMRRMGDIQNRDQYVQALQDPSNRELMNNMGAARLRRIMQTRPDTLLRNYQSEVNAQTQLAQALREQTNWENTQGAKALSAALGNAALTGDKAYAATIYPRLWRLAQGNPIAMSQLAYGAASLGLPTSSVPVQSSGQVTPVADPTIQDIISKKAVPITSQSLDQMLQFGNTALNHYLSNYGMQLDETGSITFPKVDAARKHITELIEKEQKINGKDYSVLDTLNNFNNAVSKYHYKYGLPEDFIANEIARTLDSPIAFTRILGADPTFGGKVFEEKFKKLGKTFAKDYSDAKRLAGYLKTIQSARATFEPAQRARDTARARMSALPYFPGDADLHRYRIDNEFATQFAPVYAASEGINSLYSYLFPDAVANMARNVPGATPVPTPNAGTKARNALDKATKDSSESSKPRINPDDLYGVS